MREIPTNAVKAVIRNSNNEILFLRRHHERDGPTNWDLPGGLRELGEEEVDTLVREVEEELGVVASVDTKIGEWSFHRPLDDKTVSVKNFKTTVESENFTLSEEHREAKWFREKDLSNVALKDVSILSALS